MSGKSKSTTTENKSNTFDPWVTSFGKDIVGSAGEQIANNPWQAYGGPTSAGYGQNYQDTDSFLRSMLGQVQPDTNMASSNLATFMQSVDPTKSVASFMNPYTDQVLQPTLRNINEAAGDKSRNLAREATMSGAFGDSSHGVQKNLLERERLRAVGDATAGAYDKAYSSAVGQRDSELAKFLSGIGAGANLGQSAYGQQTGLAQILAGLGQQQQQAGQTGIQNDIALNLQNQQMPLQQHTNLAQILAMIPKNTSSYGTSQTTQPDNSMLALISSLI